MFYNFKLSFLFLLLSQTRIVGVSSTGGTGQKTDRPNLPSTDCQPCPVSVLVPERVRKLFAVVSGSVPCIPETFIQFGKTETAVYLRPLNVYSPLERICPVSRLSVPLFELDSDTLFR